MKLYLIGHEYKYAVEQMISTLFPLEKPEYLNLKKRKGLGSSGAMQISLSSGEKNITAYCVYFSDEGVWRGRASSQIADIKNDTDRDSICQKIIKTAVYRAVLRSGRARPPWGALTGVRPGKLMHAIMLDHPDKAEAVNEFMSTYDVSYKRAQLCYETSLYTHDAQQYLQPEDICLYVGIPFCPTRCAYCSFVSQSVEKSMTLVTPFMEALFKELTSVAFQVKVLGLRVVSIYMGGGTPTTLSAPQLDELCTRLENEFDLSALREYTVEAGRPDTITPEKLQVLKQHGVDRVSVNPQSMRDSVLDAIGRKHTAADIESALEKVKQTGSIAVNMDLIAGLPSDDIQGFKYSIDKVLSLSPENITVHTLSLKRGSGIMRGGTAVPGAEEVSEMLDYAYKRLREEGYSPYYLYRQKNMSGGFENTGWTKKGYVNLYNICMMEELCTILAMGGGGSTKLIKCGNGKNSRITAPKYPLEYIEQIAKTCEGKKKISEFYNNTQQED